MTICIIYRSTEYSIICRSCFTLRLKLYLNETSSHQRRTPQCNRCCYFDYHSKSTTNVYKPPSHYPKTKHLQSPPFPKDRDFPLNEIIQHLYPTKITYDDLVTGVKAACYNFYKNTGK